MSAKCQLLWMYNKYLTGVSPSSSGVIHPWPQYEYGMEYHLFFASIVLYNVYFVFFIIIIFSNRKKKLVGEKPAALGYISSTFVLFRFWRLFFNLGRTRVTVTIRPYEKAIIILLSSIGISLFPLPGESLKNDVGCFWSASGFFPPWPHDEKC